MKWEAVVTIVAPLEVLLRVDEYMAVIFVCVMDAMVVAFELDASLEVTVTLVVWDIVCAPLEVLI